MNRFATWLPHLGFIIVYILWGINTPFMKIGGREWDPVVFNGVRFLMIVPILWLLSWYLLRKYQISMRIAIRDLMLVAFLGILSGVGMEVLLSYGLQSSNSANGAVLGRGVTPIVTAVIALFLRDLRITPRIVIGIPLAFISILVIVSGSGFHIGADTLKGDIVLLCRGFIGAFYLILMSKLITRYPFYYLVTLEMTAAAAVLLPFVLLKVDAAFLTEMKAVGWTALIYCAILGSLVGFLLHNWSMSKLGPFKSASYGYLLPLTSAFGGWMMLCERISVLQALGGMGVLTGMWLVQKDRMEMLRAAQIKTG